MKKICIIPARGGSKRIPRKNIRKFLGKPIIVYSIEAAMKSNLFDEIMVSTDDKEIAKIAKAAGANVPFLRSSKKSDDISTTYDVIEEVTNTYKKIGKSFDYTCCLYATAPFVTAGKLVKAYDKMIVDTTDAVFTIQKFSYPAQRGLSLVNGKVKFIWPKNINKRSQDLETVYHDSGQFYIYNTQKYLACKGIFKMNNTAIIISEMEAQDIDTETDWEIAEFKYNLMKQ